jgi:ParB/RepB/Spo0J family partition protein
MATKTRKTPAAPTTTATAAPALQFIELDKIRANDQVRTEFDDQAMAELAESIKQQGILQPVLLRPDPNAIGTFIIIAGERRVRAAHLAALTAVPALIGETDEAKAAEMQLVENIQRVDLSLADTAAAVRQLYERHQKFAPIVELTGKSMSWVSKHIAIATKLSWRAKILLDSGKTEDLELLLTVSQIEGISHGNGKALHQLLKDIEQGRAGRTEARELLAELKEKAAAEKKAKAKTKKSSVSKPAKPPPWTAHDGMCKLGDLINTNGPFDLDAAMATWTDEQQHAMCALVQKSWDAGNLSSSADKLLSMRHLLQHKANHYGDEEDDAAYILGANGIELSLRDLIIEWRAIAE